MDKVHPGQAQDTQPDTSPAAGPRPVVSVITVTRNDLSGLEATCRSLVEQTFGDWEHVVIDGASSDGSPDWMRAHPTSPSMVLVSEPDAGIYDAMNKGLRR